MSTLFSYLLADFARKPEVTICVYFVDCYVLKCEIMHIVPYLAQICYRASYLEKYTNILYRFECHKLR